ncbi:MAG: LamG domain-containing protein [Candidatus Aenigmatarchaeota archaeon]
MKGISPMITGVIFVLITIIVATLVAGWISLFSKETVETLHDTSRQKMSCQQAGIYIDKIVYDCNYNCITAYPYMINATIRNPGSVSLGVSKVNTLLGNGDTIGFETSQNIIEPGSKVNVGFNDILIYSEPKIPISIIGTPFENDSWTVGLWHFDESGNIAIDSADGNIGHAIDMKDGSGPTVENGKFNSARKFDGTGDTIIVNDSKSLGMKNNMTIDLWINPSSLCDGHIVSKNMSYSLSCQNGYIIFDVYSRLNSRSLQSSQQVDSGKFSYITATYNRSEMKIYINRTEVGSIEFTEEINVTASNLTIGSFENSSFFSGTIDELRISNSTRVVEKSTDKIELFYSISQPNIKYVRIYNSSGLMDIDETCKTNPCDLLSNSWPDLPIGEYKIEVEDSDGKKTEKWYPYQPGSQCLSSNEIDKIIISSPDCPAASSSLENMFIDFLHCYS